METYATQNLSYLFLIVDVYLVIEKAAVVIKLQ